MAKPNVYGIAILAFILIVTVVVFALSLAIFIKVKNNEENTSPVEQPATSAPVTQPPGSDLFWYNGKFLDENTEWNDQWSNPTSSAYSKQRNLYEMKIKQALVSVNTTAYHNSIISIESLGGYRIDSIHTATIVQFSLGVSSASSSSDIADDLERGSQQSKFIWRVIQLDQSGLVPLPEPDHTAGWKAAADMFLSSMNSTVDPCEDFFHYSCGQYIADHPLGNATSQGTFNVLQKQVFDRLGEALEGLLDNPNTTMIQLPETVKMALTMYNACISVSNDTYSGPQLVLNIADVYGGWPILNSDWNIARLPFDIYQIMGEIYTKHGVSTLLTPLTEINLKNVKSNNQLFLEQASLAIPSAYYKSPNLTDTYQTLLHLTIQNVIKSLGTEITEDILGQIDRIVQIDYHLANISVDATDQRNMSMQYNPYTLETASSEYTTIKWASYFKGLLDSVFPGEDPAEILNPFIISEPDYIRQLDEFLKEYTDPAKLKDLVNYLIGRLITPYLQFAGPEANEAAEVLRRETRIEETELSQQQGQCVGWLVSNLPYAAGRIYIDTSFPTQNRDDVSVMINNILSSFSSSLSGLNWMDNPTALSAFNKVAGLIRNVAYPDFQQDDLQLDAYYDSLIKKVKNIDPQETLAYYKYFTESNLFQGRLTFGDLKKSGNRFEFLMSPAVVNAWYQPERNSITFPAAILNPPFYRNDFPKAVNYGGLGVVMGHELSHGFDDQGVQFDTDGTLHTWMTQQAEFGFQSMAQCVVNEYSQFCYPQACINGITTQGENIGDNGGLKAAYRAYKAYVAAHGEEKALPGMETFNMDQIFFLSYAQAWCGSYSESALTRLLLTNPHCPGKDRVIGAVQNFPKFAEAFKCKPGDPMYPKNACNVW